VHAFTSWPRPLLLTLGLAFAAATTLYSALWMYGIRVQPKTYLGVEAERSEEPESLQLREVKESGPAYRAGLRVGDRILAVNGRQMSTRAPFTEVVTRGEPGDRVRFTVARPGTSAPFSLDVVLEPRPPEEPRPLSRRLADEVLASYPVLFLAVSVSVLFLRLNDRNAWLLALHFAGLIASAPMVELNVDPAFRGFLLAYKIAFYGCWPAVFLYFFSVFPGSSPLDRRLPWLKTLWLAAGLTVSLPLAAWALAAGSQEPLVAFTRDLAVPVRAPLLVYFFGGSGLGLVSLAGNALRGSTVAKRKSRVIVWGTLVGFGPAFLLSAAAYYADKPAYTFPFWVWAPCIISLFFMPLSFAYAVVKHRVFEIPVLLRKSARYLLVQRGSIGLLLLLGITATLSFALSFGPRLGPGAQPVGIALGAVFGTVLIWAGMLVQRRVGERIDRAFFRSAYDARQILQDLAEKARAATSREDLAALLEHHVGTALLPRSLAVYLASSDGALEVVRGSVAEGCETLSAQLPILAELARRGLPCDVPPPVAEGGIALGPLAPLEPDCLVPIVGRDGRLTGTLVLGSRLSEDPYSREDKQLLASVASQAGIALDGIRLAAQMAERLESERRADHEMELARQVQGRLLPQQAPVLATLECAACCVQARAVGGDYYDFLELGADRVGLVLADISGKGFPAALLMASLQASLRSRSAHDMLDLPRQLESVNKLLYKFSEANRFATMFLGLYDDADRRLLYANCGHNPPVVLRKDGSVERLCPTASVLGIFDEWECQVRELRLESGDLLTVFSDGITEAFSGAGEEFGEHRLIEILRGHRPLSLASLVDVVIGRVAEFSGGEQTDDQTLVMARVR
jgi:sigma-B regulation protein RsbU (phosphoserine phosphatase)